MMQHYKEQLLCCDFYVVESLFLKTYSVLFFLEIGTRRVHLAGVTANPNGHWVAQHARQYIWAIEEREEIFRSLIHDNDRKLTQAFDAVFQSKQISVIHMPLEAPNANDYASCCISMERFGMTSRGWGRELSLHPCCLVGTASPVGSSYRYSGFSE